MPLFLLDRDGVLLVNRPTNIKTASDLEFIAGANEDTPAIAQLRDKLSKDGNVVFFCRFCTGVSGLLCDSQTVGAFFATAGAAVCAFSPASEESRYLPNEIAAALNAKQGRMGILLFTPADLKNAAENNAAVRIANSISPDDSQANGKLHRGATLQSVPK